MTPATIDASVLPGRATDSRSLLWWGMVGLILIEGTMVGLLLAAYYYLRLRALNWPPPLGGDAGLLLPTLGLGALLLSLVPTHWATAALEKNDHHGAFWGTFLCLVLSLLLGVCVSMPFAAVSSRSPASLPTRLADAEPPLFAFARSLISIRERCHCPMAPRS